MIIPPVNGHRQQGIALLSVLFVVVILTVLVSQLLTLGWRNLERTQWLQDQAQAYQYALGGEQLARQILFVRWQALREEGLNISPIPGPPARYQPDRGEIRLQITDLQGRLNLNNIQDGNRRSTLQRFFADTVQQPQLIAPLADWTDGDSLPRAGGQEDSHYLSQSQPYRAGNRLLAHWNELKLLESNLEPDAFSHLGPWLTTLPGTTPLNINTLAAELATLIHPGLSPVQLAASQVQGGFQSTQAFLQNPITAGLEIDTGAITVTSGFFQAAVLATHGGFEQSLVSRFYFNPVTGDIDLLDRSLLMATLQQRQLQDFTDFQDDTDTAL